MKARARVLGLRVLLAAAIAWAPAAHAAFHLWTIQQIFSNADGSVQFVVLHVGGFNGEEFLAGHTFIASGGGVTNTFTFPSNLPSNSTANHSFLIATQGFAALGILTPDYVIPNGFLPLISGTLNYAGVNFVNYASLPTDGMTAITANGAQVPNLATNFAGASASVVPPPPVFGNFQGLWWASPPFSESGWGINLNHQGTTIFATWFTYGLDGKPTWFVVSATSTPAAPNTFSGNLFTGTGPPFSAFDPSKVMAVQVGTVTFTFTDINTATFAYTVNGIAQQKVITRELFGASLPACAWGVQPNLALATNFQDLWWNAPASSEPGWGVNFTHQNDTIFASWFTYGADGNALWFVAAVNKSAPNVYTGTIVQPTSGPPFNSVPFDPSKVVGTPVGTLTITFADGNNASFAYTVGNVSQVKQVTREVFNPPGTVCQ